MGLLGLPPAQRTVEMSWGAKSGDISSSKFHLRNHSLFREGEFCGGTPPAGKPFVDGAPVRLFPAISLSFSAVLT
jgi:hypothetical protein